MKRPSGSRGERRRTSPLRVVPAPREGAPARDAFGGDSTVAAPPRLILRFAIYTAIGLAFAAGAILLFVRSYVTSQSENSVRYHASFVAEVALGDRLLPSDFAAPATAKRRVKLDRLFDDRVLLDGALRAALYAPNGRVTYASDHRLAGLAGDEPGVRSALRGALVRSDTSDLRMEPGAPKRKVLRVFVPVRFSKGGAAGVFVLYQDYGPIATAAREAFLPIAGVLQLVLLALYISLFPILRRVTQRMRRQLHEIEHQALHDGLTGLPNRRLFRDRIEQVLASARRSGNEVAVMLIDLDRFKEINDTLGHQSGDALLQEIGARLRDLLRETDTIARLGGDEFGVVLPLDPGLAVVGLVERIGGAIEAPVVLDGMDLTVGASIGVAFFPRDGDDVETLTKRADVAMYVAKAAGTGHAFYESDRDSNDASRLALASELRAAIEAGELVLHYQPKVALSDSRVEAVEALVRWEHPDRGLLMPSEFVPLAEDAGLINKLTTFVLDEALRQCRAWDDEGLSVRIAVNIAVRSLLDARFAEEVAGLLGKRGLAPDRLELEITEGSIMADPGRVQEVARLLRGMGVQLAIDDFGTGYSSFAHLRALPIDELKIDQSFIADMARNGNVAAIVRTMIELGRSLGLRVVAEGVESRATRRRLETLGCRYAQGFLLAKPEPAERTAELLRAGPVVRRLPDRRRKTSRTA